MAKLERLAKAGVWPRVLSADLVAVYLSISRSQFFRLIDEGVYPKGFANGRLVQWDRFDLDDAIEALKAGHLTPTQYQAVDGEDPILKEIEESDRDPKGWKAKQYAARQAQRADHSKRKLRGGRAWSKKRRQIAAPADIGPPPFADHETSLPERRRFPGSAVLGLEGLHER